MNVRVARLSESDWRLFATVRLRALADSVGTHDAQYEQESTFTAAQWRRRLRAHAQFIAVQRDRPVGLIGAQQESAQTVYLYSLWIDPSVRGHGLGGRLVTAAVDWARGRGARTITLRVAADNTVAKVVYESVGFCEVRSEQTDGSGEVAMSLSVR